MHVVKFRPLAPIGSCIDMTIKWPFQGPFFVLDSSEHKISTAHKN